MLYYEGEIRWQMATWWRYCFCSNHGHSWVLLIRIRSFRISSKNLKGSSILANQLCKVDRNINMPAVSIFVLRDAPKQDMHSAGNMA